MTASIQLTARDLRVLSELGDLGLLDMETIHRRHWPTDSTVRACQRRLKLYRDLGFTRPVQLTVWLSDTSRGGRLPTIHLLTDRGAQALAEVTGEHPRRVHRADPKPETLHHRLAIVKVRLAVDDACRLEGLAAPSWIMEHDSRPDARRGEPPSSHRLLYHVFREGEKNFTCQPDAACLLRIPKNDGRGEPTTLLCLWEIDRSTERLKQVLQKLPGYGAYVEQHAYRRYWPAVRQPLVRVFWVCESHERIRNICEAIGNAPVAKLFRFATTADLAPAHVLNKKIWKTVDGDMRGVLLSRGIDQPPRK